MNTAQVTRSGWENLLSFYQLWLRKHNQLCKETTTIIIDNYLDNPLQLSHLPFILNLESIPHHSFGVFRANVEVTV